MSKNGNRSVHVTTQKTTDSRQDVNTASIQVDTKYTSDCLQKGAPIFSRFMVSLTPPTQMWRLKNTTSSLTEPSHTRKNIDMQRLSIPRRGWPLPCACGRAPERPLAPHGSRGPSPRRLLLLQAIHHPRRERHICRPCWRGDRGNGAEWPFHQACLPLPAPPDTCATRVLFECIVEYVKYKFT